jgi:predicted lipoprotein with Yx(FWY)xxD motif
MAKRIRKEHDMKVLVVSIGTVVAALSISYGLGIASASSNSTSAATTVGTASSKLGRILVDRHGRTLYLFAKDKRGKSACSGTCAAYWPPLIASSKPHAVTGAKQSLLGTTRRADGRMQVTYRHHPLYRFSGDTRKGLTSGQGLDDFGGKWWVVSPSGNKIATGGSAGPGY